MAAGRRVYKPGMIRLGYPTQNLTIPAGTNRTCRLASLNGVEKVRALIRENLVGLATILHWNAGHDVGLFRMGQALIPFASRPAFDLSLPTWESRGVRPKLHLSSQNPEKQAGAHAYSIEEEDWEELKEAIDGREADVMVEAKGKEHALIPLGIEIEDTEVIADG